MLVKGSASLVKGSATKRLVVTELADHRSPPAKGSASLVKGSAAKGLVVTGLADHRSPPATL